MNVNPYAPPAPTFAPPGAERGLMPGASLKTWKLILGVAMCVESLAFMGFLTAASIIRGRAGDPYAFAGVACFFLSCITFVVLLVIALLRVYRLWKWIPPEHRWASFWKRYISPGAAVGFGLIPYFNVFWFIVLYIGTCEALDRMRAGMPATRASPKGLAIATVVVSFFFFPAAIVLDYLFDREVDAIVSEIEDVRLRG
jgi:hypothetical protein